MIRFACPGCGGVFTVGDDKAGKTGKCPKCATQFEIPAPDARAAPPPLPPPPPVDVFAPRPAPPPPPSVRLAPVPPPPATAGVVELACPSCKGALAVNASDLGTAVECPYCKKVFTAAKPGTSPPPAPSKSQRTLDDVLGSAGRRSTDDAEDDRPSRRRRPRGDDEEDDRPSRRGRSRRDDEDDRPIRRRRDEDDLDDDRPRRRRSADGNPAFGIVSLVTGILALLSLCCCLFLPPPLSLVAIVTGVIGLRSSGRGMAIGGLVCGILATLLTVLFFVLGVGLNLLGNAVQQKQVQQQQMQNQNPRFR